MPGVAVSRGEQAAAEALARALAIALGDSAVRQQLKVALATSGVRENKLHFASFIEGRGGNIVSAMARRADFSPSMLASAIGAIRDLEFYMPVAAHRRMWNGTGQIRVGAALDEESLPVAFGASGTREVLRLDTPPAEPLLVLTATETDFTAQREQNIAGRAMAPCVVNAMQTLAEAAQACDVSSSVRGGDVMQPDVRLPYVASSPVAASDTTLRFDQTVIGLYANYITLVSDLEPWFRGSPEIELHTFAKRSRSDGSARMFQCSGARANDAGGYQPGNRSQSYVFDQNGETWSGEVLLLDPTQLDLAQSAEADGFNVSVWEDDDTSCEIKQKSTSSYFQNLVRATAGVVRGVTAIRARGGPNYAVVAESFGAAAGDLYSLFVGGDDYAGVLVVKDSTPYSSAKGVSHVIYKGTQLFGFANLYLKVTTRSLPTPGSVAKVELSPKGDTLVAGNALQLTAYPYDANGILVPNKTAVWQTTNSPVASVSSAGFVSAKSAGSTTVTASIDGIAAAVPITVTSSAVKALSALKIYGPSSVRPSSQCFFTASFSGGKGPFTYSWTINGQPAGFDGSEFSEPAPTRSFTLEVTVTDATGDDLTAWKDVEVSSAAPNCML